MANLQARKNKAGQVISYSIRVYRGRDPESGRQLKPYASTWRVPQGWNEKRARREAERQAVLFEKQCREGLCADGRQTFSDYAGYVLALKEREGLKRLTLLHYRQSLQRVLPYLGPLRLREIRPQHLNEMYQRLSQPEARADNLRFGARPGLWELLDRRNAGNCLTDSAGRRISLDRLRRGQPVKPSTAQRIAEVLGQPVSALFSREMGTKTLSAQTILDCHLLASAVLGQAERELLIPFNPAHRATPPRRERPDPNYFQPEEVSCILAALEEEPLKWQAAVELLLVTGCRRGELLGLKWGQVDWEHRQIHIDCTLIYVRGLGVTENPPKTRESVRTVKIPEETVLLLARHKKEQDETRLKLGLKWKDSPYVFPGERGGPMNPSNLGNWLTRFQKRHGLPHLNPHAFRHTMSSILFFHGVDTVSISRRLGHSSVTTTTSIYSHVMAEAEERVSDCMAEVLLESRGKLKES